MIQRDIGHTTQRSAAANDAKQLSRNSPGAEHYSLPQLPFADQSFDQTFSAHLLVTYSSPESGGILTNSPFTEHWHQAAITELLRVTKRALHVYPTTTRTSPARRHPYLEHIVAQLQASGVWTCRYQPSTYHRGDSAQNLLNASLVIERVSSDHVTL